MEPRRLRDWLCFACLMIQAGILGGCAPGEATKAPTVAAQKTEIKREPPARITGTLPAAGEILGESLTVVFDRPIRPLKADAPGTASQGLLIEPRVAGEYQYGPNFIHLKIARVPPNSIFEVRPNPMLNGGTSATAQADTAVLHFTSFEFKPNRLGFLDQTSTKSVLALEFNAEVSIEDLRGRLGLADSKQQPVPFELEAASNNRTARIIVATGVEWPLTARVAAGMPEAKNRIRTAKEFELRSSVGQPLTLSLGYGIKMEADGQTVTINTNYPVNMVDLHGALKVASLAGGPTRDLPTTITAMPNQTSFQVKFSAPNPRNFQVRLSVDRLKSTTGIPLENGWSEERSGRIALRFRGAYWGTDQNPPQLSVTFDQNIDADDFRRLIRVEPAVEGLRIEAAGGQTFNLRAKWKKNTSYQLRLEPGARFFGWAVTDAPLTHRAGSFKNLEPRLEFPMGDKYYFPRRYGNGVPLETRGLDAVDVKLYRVFPNNLPLAIEEIDGNSEDYYDYRRGGRNARLKSTWSELLAEKTMAVNQDEYNSTYTVIRLDRITSAPLRGIYCISAEAKIQGENHNYYRERMRIVLLTSLGVLAHWQDDQLVLFAHNLFTLAPAGGARVRVYSEKNQLLGEARTDQQGIARLRNFKKGLGTPRVAVVESAGDSTFLKLDPQSNERVPIDYGDPEYDAAAYDGFIYADRELYRPGETVYLRWLVRQGYGNALTSAPLLLEIAKPDGRTLTAETVRLSEWGTAGYDLKTQKSHPTGRYHATLKIPGGETIVAGYEFQLEEFVPNRMKAEVFTSTPLWIKDRGPFALRVRASHLFGGAATSRTAEASLNFIRGHAFTQWPDYNFDHDGENETISSAALGEKLTDDKGEAVFEYDGARLQGLSFPVQVRASARVHELGGRAVAAGTSAVYFPAPVLIGIAARAGDEREDVEIRVAAIRPDETVADIGEATVTLEKMAWDYYVRRYYTHYSAEWTDRYEPVETRKVGLKEGLGTTTFNAADYGYYRVTAKIAGSSQYSTQFFYSCGGKPRVSRAPEQSLIKLSLDKAVVNAGERVKVRIESPFDGKAIVIVQHGGVKRVVPVTVKNQNGEIELVSAADWAPNVWIEATVIHAVEEGRKQVYPFSSFAMTALRVKDPAREIKVTLPNLAREIAPETRTEIVIETRDERGRGVAAEVTLAAVDEGIHSITGYRKPDPLGWLARRRRPDLRRANYYDLIAEKWQPPTPGGDEEMVSRRVGRAGQNWIKTVALWSGVVRTGSNGRATVTLNIPEFNGQLRLVAVAVNASATGSTEAQLFVRRPWMMQTSMPRFLLPGDSARCRMTLFNTTATTCTARASWATSGTLGLAESSSGTLMVLGPGGEASAVVGVRAHDKSGRGMLVWRAAILSETGEVLQELIEHANIPVSAPAAYESRAELRVIKPGEQATFEAADFVQDDWTILELAVGGDPLLRLRKNMQFVIGYPYGCVEQTTSKLMPLYLIRKNAGLVEATVGGLEELDEYLRFGIDRLFSMQTMGGGLGFWPGAQEPYDYGSIYALHFLTLARNGREIPIDEPQYEALRGYVRGLTADAFNESASGLYLRAYAIYVLVLGGDVDAAAQIERFDQMSVPRSARYLLAGALAIATHDSDRVKLYLSKAPSFEQSVYESAGTLNTPTRNHAVELLSLIEMKRSAEEIVRMADLLIREMESRPHMTTQEHAFAITALCKYIETINARVDLVKATIEWPGGRNEISGGEKFKRKSIGAGQRFTVHNSGQSELYANVVRSGVPLAPPEKIEAGASISRRFINRDGSPADPGQLKQGETYVVELAIRCNREARHFVVADLLPGGLEIENPRLNARVMEELAIYHSPAQPSHLEIRDDRLVLVFDRLATGAEPHRFYYVVNAVTPGEFVHPGVTGECMYDPATRCAAAPGRVAVKSN